MILDTLLVIVLAGCMVFGLGTGPVRQFFILGGVYLGLIVASLTYKQIASLLAIGVAQPRLAQAFGPIGYLIAMIVTMLVVTLLSYREYPQKEILGGLFTGERLAGAAMAAVWGFFLIGGVLMALEFLAVAEPPVSFDTRQAFLRILVESRFRPVLLDETPLLREALRMWAPAPF